MPSSEPQPADHDPGHVLPEEAWAEVEAERERLEREKRGDL